MQTRHAATAKVAESAPVGSPRGRVLSAIADGIPTETQTRIALGQLRLRGERNFSRYAPECWEEPLSSKEKQCFGKPLDVRCWCSESPETPHISKHYK